MVWPKDGVDAEPYEDVGDRAGSDGEEGKVRDDHVVRELLSLGQCWSVW